MLQYILWLLLFVGASNNSVRVSDAVLVASVKITLDECSGFVDAVGNFIGLFKEDKARRRSLSLAVKKKLKTCEAIIETVNDFRENHFSPIQEGHIKLNFDEARFLSQALQGVSKQIGKTLYVASRDGDSAATFHKLCNDKGPTVVIIKSTNGAVFGGYTDLSWKSVGNYVKSTASFLFRLRPVMTKYTIKSGREAHAIYDNSGYGPTFGAGHDIYVVNNALSSTSSYTNGGNSYNIPSYPNFQLTDGTKQFKVKDYIVVEAV